jgi:hypothetical protein
MRSHRTLFTHLLPLGAVAFAAAFTTIACHDEPTAPSLPQPAAAMAVPGDSGAPEIVFLPPLGPRNRPRGVLDTTVAPSVVICRLDGERCGSDTVARFAPPLRDTAGVIASGDTLGDTPTDRVTLAERAYVARWHMAALRADTAVGYRVVVALGDTTVGAMDLKIVPDRYVPPPADTARYAFITQRRLLRVRFQIFLPPTELAVVLGPGVLGTPANGSAMYRYGSTVHYQFEPDSGYTNVLVTVDGELVSKRGKIVMNRPHAIVASADRNAKVRPGDEWIVSAARTLLRSRDPVASAQALLDTLDTITDTVNLGERLEQVERAVMAQADSTAVRALDAALTGRTFEMIGGMGQYRGDALAANGGSGASGALLAPRATLGAHALVASTSVSPFPGNGESMTIGFVNGVLTTPFGALFSANQLARAARAANWNANTPFEVKLIYNRTAMRYESSDIRERCIMRIGSLRGLGWLSLPTRLGECMGERTAYYPRLLGDFVESAEQLAAILSRPSFVQLADVDSVAASVTRWRNAGDHVVLVGHSQGNFMIQQGIAKLRDRGDYRPATDTTCIGVVSLAAPSSRGWPVSDRHLRGLAVEGDVILTIGLNDFRRVRTPLTDSADRDGSQVLRRIAPDVARAIKVGWGLRMHEFVQSYVRPEPIRGLVQEALVQTYRSCGLGTVRLSSPALQLRTGESAVLTATLTDMLGEPLDGTRGVRWVADQVNDRQRAVQLSPDGRVAGRYVGATNIRAETRTRTGTGGVEILPAQLGVRAVEKLSAQWALVYGGPVNSSQPFGPVPPPPAVGWNGDSCIAKTTLTYDNWQGVYSKECTARYEVGADPFSGATRYSASFYRAVTRALATTVSGTAPPLVREFTGPLPTLDPLPGPSLIDRIVVTASDAAGHQLAEGVTCVRGCVGW